MELNTDAYYDGLTEQHFQNQSDISEMSCDLKAYKEAFNLCYDHLCDLHFCVSNPSPDSPDFQAQVLKDIKETANSNAIFIAKKKEEG